MGTTENDLSTDPINPVSNESCHEPGDDEIEDVSEYKPKWEINYDAIYAAQDDEVDGLDNDEEPASIDSEVPKSMDTLQSHDTMDTTEDKLSADPLNPVSNDSCHEPDDDEIEDVSEYKPKWEINYDAIYAAQDDEVDDGVDEVEELSSLESEVLISTDIVQCSVTMGTNE